MKPRRNLGQTRARVWIDQERDRKAAQIVGRPQRAIKGRQNRRRALPHRVFGEGRAIQIDALERGEEKSVLHRPAVDRKAGDFKLRIEMRA